MPRFRMSDTYQVNHPLGAIADFPVGNRKGLLLWSDDHRLYGRGKWAVALLRRHLWPETYPDWKSATEWYGLLIDMLTKEDTGHRILIIACSQKVSTEQAGDNAGGHLMDEREKVEESDARDGLALETLEIPFPIAETGLRFAYDREGCDPTLVELHRCRTYRSGYREPPMTCLDEEFFLADPHLDRDILVDAKIPHLSRPGVTCSGIIDRPFLTIGRGLGETMDTVHVWQEKESPMPISFGCSHIPIEWLYTLDASIVPALLTRKIIEVVGD